jgi:Outer membrane protein beta-barrel domain
MRITRSVRILAGTLTGLFAMAGTIVTAEHAAAEGFVDLYLGAGFPQNDHLHLSADNPAAGVPAKRNAKFYVTPSAGVRGGYWFEGPARFVGLALDLSYYRYFQDTSRAAFDFIVLPMTPLLMARLPLGERNESFPGGRFQPYAAIGPALNLSFAYGDLSELNTGIDDFGDASFDVGLDARGGLAVQISRRIALFTEYRFTYLKPNYHDEVGFPGPNVDVDVDATLATHHLVFGVSFRF